MQLRDSAACVIQRRWKGHATRVGTASGLECARGELRRRAAQDDDENMRHMARQVEDPASCQEDEDDERDSLLYLSASDFSTLQARFATTRIFIEEATARMEAQHTALLDLASTILIGRFTCICTDMSTQCGVEVCGIVADSEKVLRTLVDTAAPIMVSREATRRQVLAEEEGLHYNLLHRRFQVACVVVRHTALNLPLLHERQVAQVKVSDDESFRRYRVKSSETCEFTELLLEASEEGQEILARDFTVLLQQANILHTELRTEEDVAFSYLRYADRQDRSLLLLGSIDQVLWDREFRCRLLIETEQAEGFLALLDTHCRANSRSHTALPLVETTQRFEIANDESQGYAALRIEEQSTVPREPQESVAAQQQLETTYVLEKLRIEASEGWEFSRILRGLLHVASKQIEVVSLVEQTARSQVDTAAVIAWGCLQEKERQGRSLLLLGDTADLLLREYLIRDEEERRARLCSLQDTEHSEVLHLHARRHLQIRTWRLESTENLQRSDLETEWANGVTATEQKDVQARADYDKGISFRRQAKEDEDWRENVVLLVWEELSALGMSEARRRCEVENTQSLEWQQVSQDIRLCALQTGLDMPTVRRAVHCLPPKELAAAMLYSADSALTADSIGRAAAGGGVHAVRTAKEAAKCIF